MDFVNINTLDLNLLRTFVVLMEERNVSKASTRLNLSQSATSNALERIRESFNDRVLEREGRTMQPTRAALALWPKISAALIEIESALGEVVDIDPLTMHNHFTLVIDEYSMALFGPSLLSTLSTQAPHCTFSVLAPDLSRIESQLAHNDVDIAVMPIWNTIENLVNDRLYQETFVGLMDKRHSLVKSNMTINRFANCPHVLVSTRGLVQGNVDAGLKKAGKSRDVVVTTAYLDSAPTLLANTENLLSLGQRLATQFSRRYQVVTFDLPVSVPGFSVYMLWHPRATIAPAHQWLRTQIKHCVGEG